MERGEKPWETRDDWASGWLKSATADRTAVLFLWCFTVVWNAMSWFAQIEVWRGNATGHTDLAPIFPALGLGVLALAAYVTVQYRRWGGTRLELLTRPGVLGGPLRGVLHASPGLSKAADLHVSLDCRGPEPGRDGSVRVIKHLWHYEERVPRARFAVDSETRVPLDFRLPHTLPESDPRRSGEDAVWTLRAHAALPGANYDALFELPVFRTDESSAHEEGSRVAPAPLRSALCGGEVGALPNSKIRVRPYGVGGVEVVFGALRNPWMGILTALCAAFFYGLVALIRYAEGPGLFFLVFALADLFLAYAAVDTLLGVTRVRAERGLIAARHGPFGIGPSRRVQLHELERVRVVPQVRYGSRTYSQLRIERRARAPGERAWRRRIGAGSRIPTLAEAEALARALEEAAGLSRPTQRNTEPE